MTKLFPAIALLLARSLPVIAQGGFCEYSTETARCVPAEIDAAITQDYLAFVDIAAQCIGDTAASDDGLMLAGCTTDTPECATANLEASSDPDDPQAIQSLCLPANFSRDTPLTEFLELSDLYDLCSESESVTPACQATRIAYYSALGCDFCGETEQALLVGFSACVDFADPDECAAAQPRGLEALPEESVIMRVEEEGMAVSDMVEQDRISISMRRRRPRRARPADPPRTRRPRRQRPTDPPRSRRGRGSL